MDNNNFTNQTIHIRDEETGGTIDINNPSFYFPSIPKQDNAYTETSFITINGQTQQVDFTYPDKPVTEYQLEMWDTLDKFEEKAWDESNIGIKTGYQTVDDALDGGLYPGFTIVGGDSNLGKTAFMTNLAWNVIQNNQNVYVMDFSLDDSMADKLARTAACSGHLVINAVKTPNKYKSYPLMLARRQKALLNLRNMTDKYIAYDSSHTTFVEDIQNTILSKLIYFDEMKINKKLVVFIDNFHDMDIRERPGLAFKEKFDALAQWAGDFADKYGIILICSAELKKLNGSKRAGVDDLRESVKIKYEAKAILLVYNEVHYRGESANIYYNISGNPYKQPIFEVHFAKNKFNGWKGRLFFEFYPEMAYMKECDPQTQKTFLNIVYG